MTKFIRQSVLAFALIASGFAGSPAPALERRVVDADHSSILYFYDHFGLSERNGRLSGVAGDLLLDPEHPDRSTVTVTIGTGGISSGVPALDDMLRSADFFDTARYPEAVFRSSSVSLTGPKSAKITGDLTIRGVTRRLVLDAKFTGTGVNPATNDQVAGFHAEGTLLRSDFGIKAYAPAVGDKIRLVIDAEFKLAEPAPVAK